MDTPTDMLATARCAKQAGIFLQASPHELRNDALLAMEAALRAHAQQIFTANALDMQAAHQEGLAEPLRKRLQFDAAKLEDVCAGIRALAALPDPLGRVQYAMELDEGLNLTRVSCPIGVIGVVFESRPDALVQISTLSLKSGNAVLLKGGREAARTNQALFDALDTAARQAGICAGWAALMHTRSDVAAMLAMDRYIDLIIPRGSNEFVRYIMDNTHIPVMGHADGVCHVYVDGAADIDMAVRVAVDAKAQYVAACNAAETLLVHADIAPAFLPALAQGMAGAQVSLRGCARTCALIACDAVAGDADWGSEYLDYTLNIRMVDSLDDAVTHIHTYGSRHTDAIITGDAAAAQRFMALVDSAGVYWNCSTRFADGYRYGLGAEVGISTAKLHARGPVGLEGLLIYKYRLCGAGHIVADYAKGSRTFTHKPQPLT